MQTWFRFHRFCCSRLYGQRASGMGVWCGMTILAVEVKVGTVGEERFRGLVPNGGFWTRSVFQGPSIGVKLGGERIAGAEIILEGRWPLLWHGRLRGWWEIRTEGCSISATWPASMSSARESEHIISARETLDSECALRIPRRVRAEHPQPCTISHSF